MEVNIGIPRALLYHEFGELWTNFFTNAGIPFTVSDSTNLTILNHGTELAIDESCLPLKIYLGHVQSLLERCTHIFIPRVVGYHDNFFLCAKFAGLPDIVRNTFQIPGDRIIVPNIENKSTIGQIQALNETCKPLHLSKIAAYRAYHQAQQCWHNLQPSASQPSNCKVAMIGHSYLLKDNFFCRDIFSALTKRNTTIVTPEQIPSKLLYKEAKAFQPDIYWQLSAKIAGAVRFFSRQSDISGIIMLSSFGCGPDSLINEYLEHHILSGCGKPYLIVNIDEHTGSAGMITRVEAFLDLVDWRLKSCK